MATKKAAIMKKNSPPYLFQHFNIKEYYAEAATRGLARFVNLLIEALNDRKRLPRYIMVIFDKDLLIAIKRETSKFNTGIVISATIHYIVQQSNILIERRKIDLFDRKPGALLPVDPTFIWIRMLKHPQGGFNQEVTALRGKFNSILEERLFNGKDDKHCIMSIDIHQEDFDLIGNLSSNGKHDFWHEINLGFE